MTYRLPLIVLLILSLQHVHAAGMKIIDQGMDGKVRSYRLYCEDGTRGGVTQKFDVNRDSLSTKSMGPDGEVIEGRAGNTPRLIETCVNTRSNAMECRSNWTIDDAARSFCQ